MSLKQKTAKSFAWDLGGAFVQQGSSFVISIFLARLLEPAQFGLVGIAMVFISVSQVFIDVGFSSALVQNKNNTSLTYSSVFYLNVLAGLLLTILLFSAAPWIGAFYGNPEIVELIRWLSCIFILNSFNLVQSTILKKELNFKLLTLRRVFASIAGGVVGIILAFLNYGIYSLIAQQLTAAIVGVFLLWSTVNWRPDLKFSRDEVRKLSGFSVFVFLDRFASTIFQKLDTLFIAKVFSPAILGFYSKAEMLNAQVTTYTSKSLGVVFFPVLSKVQDDDEKFNAIYFKVVSFICFLSFIVSGLLYILAEPIIITLLGKKWAFTVLLFQIIVFKSFNVPLNSIMLNALISKGRSKENFLIGLVRKFIRTLPIFVGLGFGLIPFVWSVTIVSYVLTIYNAFFIKVYLGIDMSYHLRKIFEGIVPFFALVIVFPFFPDAFFIKIVLSVAFVGVYLVYAHLIRMEGYLFAKTEFVKILKKYI